MKKFKSLFIVLVVIILVTLTNQSVLANSDQKAFAKMEYSQEFKDWLELPEEERDKVMQPRAYDINYVKKEPSNLIRKAVLLKVSQEKSFSLKSKIENNLKIRNQEKTNSCWAFAALSSLETNLALADWKRDGEESTVYDYSERHMEYATSRTFLNGEENKNGYKREVGEGGNWYLAQTYLTNGTGAIAETEMPFENNENPIELSSILNKKVSTQLYDTKEFANYLKDEEHKTEIMNEIKEHIENYGAVFTNIHGDSASGILPCYDNKTGAKFCSNSLLHQPDHAVSIIGWDDDYDLNKFVGSTKPKENGAWIVRNSWGDIIEYNKSELKQEIFESDESGWQAQGVNSADQISDQKLTDAGYTVEGEKVTWKVGDNGLIYVSYEDCNVANNLIGIVKASNKVNYENIYQYDEYFAFSGIEVRNSSAILCNVFDKKSAGPEFLTQVSLYAYEPYECEVYVNPNGDGKELSDLEQVTLKEGNSKNIDAGYHVLEFNKPIEIKGSKFAVVIKIKGTQSRVNVSLEQKLEEIDTLEYVTTEKNKCFVAQGGDLSNCEWVDLGELSTQDGDLPDGDSTIKAFTVSNNLDGSLRSIEIAKQPDIVDYVEGQDFVKVGMVVRANYNRLDNPNVILGDNDYSITNGTNLSVDQKSVTITYENLSVEQPINVEKDSVVQLRIKNVPSKVEYNEGEDFDSTGIEIEAVYKSGKTEDVTDFVVEDGFNLTKEQTEVTITYGGKSIKQTITVAENNLTKLEITHEPDKTNYVVGQNFDPTGMIVMGTFENESTNTIRRYTIEDGENLALDQTSVTITYMDQSVSQKITVEEKAAVSISVKNKPTKLKYIINEDELDLTGGSIVVNYNDGTTEEVPMTSNNITVSGFTNARLGKIILTLTYLGKTTQLEVEIIENPAVLPPVDEKAVNSNFENIYPKVKSVDGYFYTYEEKETYCLIYIDALGINRNLSNDMVEYYYHLSGSPNENNITEWTKITEEQNENNKLSFTIDTRDITNFEEISDSDELYLYIKEVAIKGGNQSVLVSKAMNLKADEDTEVGLYIDDIKFDFSDLELPDLPEPQDPIDDTMAPGNIPQTGIISISIVSILIISILGVVFFIKYNKLRDIK